MTDKRILSQLRNEDAERAVITAAILDRDAVPRCDVTPDDFTNPQYREMWATILDLWTGDEIIDFVAMMDAGFESGVLVDMMNAEYISPPYAAHYASTVKKYSTLRQYVMIAEGLLSQAYTAGQEPDTLYTWLQGQLATIGHGNKHNAVMDIPESIEFYRQLMEQRSAPVEMGDGDWSWAWPSWNSRMDPLDVGMLCLVSARQGTGKTVYAEMQAEKWAKAGNRVAFVHFELNRELMFDRRMVRHTGIPRPVLKRGDAALSAEQLRIKHDAEEQIAQWSGNIFYVHSPGWTMAQAMRTCEKLGVDAVVVDYLNKAAASSKQVRIFGSDKNGRQADDVEAVKNTMERNYWRGILLAQFNKEGKKSSEPTAEDIRGSGEIADKANVIILVNRQKVDNIVRDGRDVVVAEPGMYGPDATVTIDKNTMGVGGQIEQYFHGPTYAVYDKN